PRRQTPRAARNRHPRRGATSSYRPAFWFTFVEFAALPSTRRGSDNTLTSRTGRRTRSRGRLANPPHKECPSMVPLRCRWLLLLACLACALLAVPAFACPFCTMQGKTLTGEVDQASMVLYGKLTNPNLKNETTDLVIESVIKDHK